MSNTISFRFEPCWRRNKRTRLQVRRLDANAERTHSQTAIAREIRRYLHLGEHHGSQGHDDRFLCRIAAFTSTTATATNGDNVTKDDRA